MLWRTVPVVRRIASASHLTGTRFFSNAAEQELLSGSGIEYIPPPSIRAYFDYKSIKQSVGSIKQNMKDRNYNAVDVDHVVMLIDRRAELLDSVGRLRARRNLVASVMKEKTARKPADFVSTLNISSDPDLGTMEISALIEEGKTLKDTIPPLETELDHVERELESLAFKLPNTTHSSSPIGDESKFALLTTENEDYGSVKYFLNQGFVPKDHLDMALDLGIIDLATASKVTGPRFYYLLKEAALLELALVNYAMQKLVMKGFIPVLPPDLARNAILEGAGFQARDQKGLDKHIYSIAGSDLSLSGTAEIPMAGRYVNEILSETDLPIRTVAFNHCFRTEIGGPGQQSRGIYRVHQFSKVEMFVVATPEQAEALHEELIAIEIEMFKELGLHFRVMDMPTEDLGAPAYRKVDIEASMPGRAVHRAKTNEMTTVATQHAQLTSGAKIDKNTKKTIEKELEVALEVVKQKYATLEKMGNIDEFYGEISSASNCTDYQARRLNIRYRPSVSDHVSDDSVSTSTKFVYTLNGTACAVPRMIVAIMEQFQTADGGFEIPQVLRPFMMGQSFVPFLASEAPDAVPGFRKKLV